MAEEDGEGAERRVLLVGPLGSGKSVLLRRMCAASSPKEGAAGSAAAAASAPAMSLESPPTVGVEIERLAHAGRRLVVREVGATMKATWPAYVDSSDALLFTVDAANRPQLAEAAADLLALLARDDVRKRDLPVVVAVTKTDLECRMPREEMQEVARLDDIAASSNSRGSGRAQHVRVQEVSALTGAGINALLACLAQ